MLSLLPVFLNLVLPVLWILVVLMKRVVEFVYLGNFLMMYDSYYGYLAAVHLLRCDFYSGLCQFLNFFV